jgi:hypothetical protein
MSKIVLAFGCVFLLAACASITKGTTQVVSVTTPGVNGATCTLTSGAIGSKVVVTPGTVTLDKSQEAVNVRCTKECYLDGAAIISSNTEGMTAGNVILGGVIGLGIDAASGAMNKYASDTQIIMVADPACRKPEPPPVKKRR